MRPIHMLMMPSVTVLRGADEAVSATPWRDEGVQRSRGVKYLKVGERGQVSGAASSLHRIEGRLGSEYSRPRLISFLSPFGGLLRTLALAAVAPVVLANASPSPWAGSWKLDSVRSSPDIGDPPSVYRFTVGPGNSLRWEIPSLGEVVKGRLDGRPMAIHRSEPTPGLTLAVRAVGPREWIYRVAENGRFQGGGRMMLVEGGAAWVDLSWGPKGPGHGVELIYRKETGSAR